ncbi:MAG TPA: amino acid ABC transporter substrate-binding protein, partial [Caballeronia sp.]|nr:amino acid ABC transporter substrate-binding protein [Caballeronia sp.]
MKIFQILLLAGIVQLAAVSTAFAADDLASIKSAGVIKIGTEGTY